MQGLAHVPLHLLLMHLQMAFRDIQRDTNPIVRLSPSPHKKTDKEACFPRRIEDAKLGDYFLAFAEVKKLKSRKPPAKTWPHLDGWKPFSKPGL